MYRSPIEILMTDIQHQIAKEQDEQIYKAVVSVGINVDKDELIRALQYDRNQYREGYNNGYRDGKESAMEDIAFPRFLVRPSETSKEELEAILHSPATIITNKESITPIYPYSRWIPVAERLPETVDSYLVVVKAKYDHEDQYEIDTDVATYNPYEDGYIDGCWNTYSDWDEGQQYLHVTHWMPMPEPPKGE